MGHNVASSSPHHPALSPATNDPITAIMAIEQLRAGLCYIAERALPQTVMLDDDGAARLLVKRQDAAYIIDAAFSLIRQSGRGNLEVNLSLLDAFEQISRRTSDHGFRTELLRQAQLVEHGAQSALTEEADRQRVAERFQQLVDVLQSIFLPGESVAPNES
jgi:uncharacterized membrane protein